MSIRSVYHSLFLIFFAVLIGVSCTRSTSLHDWTGEEQERFLTAYDSFSKNNMSQLQRDSLDNFILYLKNTQSNRDFLATYIKQTDADKKYVDLYATYARVARDTQGIAKSYYLLGEFFDRNYLIDSSYYYFNQAKYSYRKLHDSVNQQKVTLIISNILADKGVFSEAEHQIHKVISLNKHTVSNYDLFNQEYLYAKIVLGLEQYTEAINRFNNALDLSTSNEVKEYYSEKELRLKRLDIYNYLSIAHIRKHQFTEAEHFLSVAFDDYKMLDKEDNIELYLKIIHNFAVVKLAKDENELALKYIKEALTLNTKYNYIKNKKLTDVLLVQYYFEIGEIFTANTILQELLEDAIKINDYKLQKEALTVLLQYDTENSKDNFQRYLELDNIINKKQTIVRNRFARLKYEADDLLQVNDKLHNQKDTIVILSFMVISFILIVVIAFFIKNKVREIATIKMYQRDTERYYKSVIDHQNAIAKVQEAERKNIARELHDGVLNKLFVTRFSLMQLEQENIEETKGLLVKEVQDVEKFIRDSSYALSNEKKLFASNFKQLIIEMVVLQNRNTAIQFDIFIDPRIELESFSHRYRISIYRIVQEALNNVQKYSNAKNCYVSFTYKTDTLVEVSVEDNGRGFDVYTTRRGKGLNNIQDRLNALNSKLVLTSTVGKGTILLFLVKIK
ncbi:MULTISPECIES: tetratricopeptide repeat-containing sensor histidine kinase [unclassified Myroides]|uniref:tetratricopeptide repeat-containing sensor histidine kinase n=1 Tax=unclassified Myroides TaxID=2642485 RepID=UPI0031013798